MAGVILCSSGLILQSRLPVGAARAANTLKFAAFVKAAKLHSQRNGENSFTQRAFGWPCLRTALTDVVEDAVWQYAVVCRGKSFGAPARSIFGVQRAEIRQRHFAKAMLNGPYCRLGAVLRMRFSQDRFEVDFDG